MSEGLRLEQLTVGYHRRAVLRDVHATARRGELTAVLGPNGTGKSTLLRTIAALLPPLGGEVRIEGHSVRAFRPAQLARRLAAVLTERPDPGMLTAREIVALGRHPHTGVSGALSATDHEVVTDALTTVEAEHLAARRITEISDGERQRVFVARALAQQPAVLLLDEPTAFLDAPSRAAVTGLLRRLAHTGLTVVMSTHELELALRVADQIWLVDRVGRVHVGSPEELTVSGVIGEVFDTEDLRFDPENGSFGLHLQAEGTVRVRGPHRVRAVAARGLARHGWQPVTTGPTDLEVSAESSDRWRVRRGGRSHELGSIDELTTWARDASHDPRPTLLRADSEAVREALVKVAEIGPYFTVATGDETAAHSGEWQPLTALCEPGGFTDWVTDVAAALGTEQRRVAASVLLQGLAARIVSPLLACAVHHQVIPDVDRWCWRREPHGPFCLATGEPGGWQARAELTPDETSEIIYREVIDGCLRPLLDSLRRDVSVAEGLLWGNVASSIMGAVRMLDGPELAEQAAELLLRTGPLQGAGRGRCAGFVRRTCCLIYRAPGMGTCDDCVLGIRSPLR